VGLPARLRPVRRHRPSHRRSDAYRRSRTRADRGRDGRAHGALARSAANGARAIPLGYRIAIARLGIDLPIAEGDLQRDISDQRTPEGSAFHLPGTAFPGEGGNVYVYAHARRGMFLTLWDARPGDEIALSTPNGVLRYIVRDVLPRVAPTDVSSAAPTTTERLTLQTSTGPSASDPRFVVFAFPAGD
jgi:LPXTG-site transpeptidase (sortase) family protein